MRKKLLILSTFITSAFVMSSVYAATLQELLAPGTFDPTSADKSVELLKNIFGQVGTILPGQPGLFNRLFEVFNGGMLILGIIVLGYTAIVSIMGTATRGEFLGKKISAWVPVRSIVGIACIFPGNTGYSIIQIGMMWLVLKSVGLADTVWGQIVDYVSATGSVVTTSTSVQNQYLTITSDLAYSFICMQRAHLILETDALSTSIGNFLGIKDLANQLAKSEGIEVPKEFSTTNTIYPTQSPIYSESVAGGNVHTSTYDFGAKEYGEKGSSTASALVKCGSFTITEPVTGWGAPTAADNERYKKMKSAFNAAMKSLNSFALIYVLDEYHPDEDLMSTYLKKFDTNPIVFNSNMLGNDLSSIEGSSDAMDATMKAFWQDTKKHGWIYAGAYYTQLAALSKTLDLSKYVSYTAPSRAIVLPSRYFYKTDSDEHRISAYATLALAPQIYDPDSGMGTLSSEEIAGDVPVIKELNMLFDFFTNQVVRMFTREMMGSSQPTSATEGIFSESHLSPLVRVQAFGYQMLQLIKTAWVIMLGILIIAATIAGICSSFLPMLASLQTLIKMLVNPFLLLAGLLFISALTMAVYVPLIPFIIFTFATLSWLIAVMESMVAAPMVAVGLANPSGHEVFGRAEPAINLMTNVFLRPTLMLFGMVVGMILSYVMVDLLNGVYSQLIMAVSGGASDFFGNWGGGFGDLVGKGDYANMSHMGGIELIMFIVIYISLVVTILNRCFALIHMLPDTVLRWIGNTQTFGKYMGEGEAGVKRAFTEGAKASKQMAKQTEKAPDEVKKGIQESRS